MSLVLPRIYEPNWGPVVNAVLLQLDDRLRDLESRAQATVGPQGPPGTGVAVMQSHVGLQMVFGSGPLPAAASMPNTVYVVLPPKLT